VGPTAGSWLTAQSLGFWHDMNTEHHLRRKQKESPTFMKDDGRRAFDFTCLAREPLLYGNLICTFEFVSESFLGRETEKHQGVFQPHGFLTAALKFQNETFTPSLT